MSDADCEFACLIRGGATLSTALNCLTISLPARVLSVHSLEHPATSLSSHGLLLDCSSGDDGAAKAAMTLVNFRLRSQEDGKSFHDKIKEHVPS